MDCFMCQTIFQGVLANATYWPLVALFTTSIMRVKTKREVTHKEISAQIQMEPKLEFGLQNHTSTKEERYEFPSRLFLPPWHYNLGFMRMKWEKGKYKFLTIKVLHPEGEITLFENMHINLEEKMRICVWDKEGKPVFNRVARGQIWRFEKENGNRINYPPGKSCPECHEKEECMPGCELQEEVGGFVKKGKSRKYSDSTQTC